MEDLNLYDITALIRAARLRIRENRKCLKELEIVPLEYEQPTRYEDSMRDEIDRLEGCIVKLYEMLQRPS